MATQLNEKQQKAEGRMTHLLFEFLHQAMIDNLENSDKVALRF